MDTQPLTVFFNKQTGRLTSRGKAFTFDVTSVIPVVSKPSGIATHGYLWLMHKRSHTAGAAEVIGVINSLLSFTFMEIDIALAEH